MNRKAAALLTIILSPLLDSIALSLIDTCNVADSERLDCGWAGINQGLCEGRSCCWKSAVPPHPYCFYDSATAAKLKTKAACEHHPPVVLHCNGNETISIHDVFYGRNNGDNSCHNDGSITCFNPNATEIVRNICKDNSTCSVSPTGSIWNFDSTCDGLNAQMIVHYICVLRAVNSSISAILRPPSSTVSSKANKNTLTSEYITVGRTEVSALLETVSTSHEVPSSYGRSSPDSTSILSTSFSSASLSTEFKTSMAATEASVTISSLTEIPVWSLSTSTASFTRVATATVSSSETTVVDMTPTSSTQASSLTGTGTLPSTKSKLETQTVTSSSASQTSQGTTSSSHLAPSQTNVITATLGITSTEISPSSSSTKMSSSTSTLETYKVEQSSYLTRSSSIRSISSQERSVSPSSSITKTHSASLSRSFTASSTTAPSSSVPTKKTGTIVSASTSRAITPSVLTTNPPSASDKNKGSQRTTTYIIIGVCVGVVVILFLAFVVWKVKKRQIPRRHNMITNDVLAAPQGIYYGLSTSDPSPGYDNPVKVDDKDGPEIVMNQLYEMTPT